MTGFFVSRRIGFFLFSVLILAVGALSGCARVPRLISEYRVNVQQGNVLTQEMVSQLRPGQTREQVRFILGTPMLADSFHANRWDYLFRLEDRKNDTVTTRTLTVFFDDAGRLERLAGNVEAGSADELNAPAAPTEVIDLGEVKPGEVELPPDEGTGVWPRIKEFFSW